MIYGQAYNNKIDAWVKMKKNKNGLWSIVQIKKSSPTKKFKGVRVIR